MPIQYAQLCPDMTAQHEVAERKVLAVHAAAEPISPPND
jgi:hypothetical protein